MALSLGWHIVFACFGVGMPLIILIAEWLGIRTGYLYGWDRLPPKVDLPVRPR